MHAIAAQVTAPAEIGHPPLPVVGLGEEVAEEINDRLGDLFALSQDVVGRTAMAAVRNADLAELLDAAGGVDEPVSGVIQLHHPAPRTLRVQAVRFPRDGREPMGTVAVFHDVTELAQLERMRRNNGGYFHSEAVLSLKLGITIDYLEQGKWRRPAGSVRAVLPQLNALFEKRFEHDD